ncbi:hypothetical protein BC827DRAFT_1385139 [Russula dissimulans]|nr:hypothetical protein BC827DRAFT_1385139 [Russula dissimulans]
MFGEHDIGFWAEQILWDLHNNAESLSCYVDPIALNSTPDLGLIGNAMTRMPAYMATLQMQAALIAFQLQDLNSNAINPTSEVHLACSRHPFHPTGPSPTPSDEHTITEWASLSTASIGHIVYDGHVFELAAINRNHIYAYYG